MAITQTSPILGYIRQLASAHLTELSDAQLLDRFASQRDETAFAVLVRRHGPLVLAVCRRVLRDWHVADDCFQITFLLLARKAGSLNRPETLGPWLYGVASRTARKVRCQAARRRRKEAHSATTEAIDDSDDREWHDLRPLLDDSVSQLPDKYRVPFVLHYLQGVTVTEVARRLGCPRGSIATRLSRARQQLRARLIRRGVAISAGYLLLRLSEASAASVPTLLMASTTRNAVRVAAGQKAGPCLFPSRTVLFTEGVIKAMRTTKARIAAGFLLAVALAAGAGMFAHRTQAADPQRAPAHPAMPAESRREQTPRKPRVRFLSLAEARAIALENGSINLSGLIFPGIGLDNMLRPPIRVLADVRPNAEGVILAGIAKDQDRAELERNVNQMLLNVETAYWNLYGSYWNLHSREQGLHLAYETWKMVGARYKVGRVSQADFAQSEGQYDLLRSQRLQAIDTVLDNERQLRTILGMDSEDGTRLVPSDAPTLVETKPDWDKARSEMLKNRPEVRLTPENKRKLAEIRQKWKNFNGSRVVDEEELKYDTELKAERHLSLYYRRLSSSYFQIKAARVQRLAFAKQLRKCFDDYKDGKEDATLDLVLEKQRFLADAVAAEFQGFTTYNNSLCGWEYAKGSILDYAHITLAEKPPADDKEVRAVEYERKQTRKKVRREEAKPVDRSLLAPEMDEDSTHAKLTVAPSLVSLWKARPPLPEVKTLPKK